MEERKENGHAKRTKGGLRTTPFIFASEISERLAVVGLGVNLVSYLTLQLHMPLTKAAKTLTNFGGTSALATFLGAFVADSFAGRFWTTTVASIIYQMGLICFTLSAVLPQLRPPPCTGNEVCKEATQGQLSIPYTALLLISVGAGGIRPNVVSYGADQFDETDPNQKTRMWNFFNWYYISLGLSGLISLTVIVYIQENVGWVWGFGIPTIIFAISIVAFVLGFPLYRHIKPSGSPFTRLAQVIVAACRKRKLTMVSDPSLLYENEKLDASISADGMLLHTDQLTFFDKAAIPMEEDQVRWPSASSSPSDKSPNLWRLSTVHRVEELKSIIRMAPIWLTGIIITTASAQQGTFTLQQVRSMDRHLGPSFQIPPASMSVFTIVSMLTATTIYDRLFIPVARRFTGLDRGITFLQRMGVGFAISVLATFVAGFVEIKRKRAAAAHGLLDSPKATIPISVFWLLPQQTLYGFAEAFMSIGHLEFFYDQSPESMRSTATAFYWTAISAGNYLSTLLVAILQHSTDWLSDNNINRARLEYFYWLIALLELFNLGFYVLCARFYTFKPIQVRSKQTSVELSTTTSV
ncbi:hypothetical protein AAC387_Pa02g4878 [Persea americana]